MTMRILDLPKVKGCGDAAVNALATSYQRLYEGITYFIDGTGTPNHRIPIQTPLRHVAPQILTACDLAETDLKRFVAESGSRRFHLVVTHKGGGLKAAVLSASEIQERVQGHIDWFRRTAQQALEGRGRRWLTINMKAYQAKLLPQEVRNILQFFVSGSTTRCGGELILSGIWNRIFAVGAVASIAFLVGGAIYHQVQTSA